MAADSLRDTLRNAQRIVIKVGTRVLVRPNGRPDEARLVELVRQIAGAVRLGRRVVLVSSGAIGAGMEALHLTSRPKTLPDLQMCAAVGQSRLMARYDQLFAAHGLTAGQVLLTHADLKDRSRHLNARNTMMCLLRHGIVPVVNENDAVSVDEIKFGDNDQLASLVAMLVDADAMLLLTTTNGVQAPAGAGGRRKRVPYLRRVDEQAKALIWAQENALSTGGMASKLESAQRAADVGTKVVIADGRRNGIIEQVLAGDDVGTLIGDAAKPGAIPSRKRWIAFFHKSQGSLVIDAGAQAALLAKGKSLLPIGILAVHGRFPLGALVNIESEDGALIGRGLVAYDSEELEQIRGRRTAEIVAVLGERTYDEAIHRDNMVVLPAG